MYTRYFKCLLILLAMGSFAGCKKMIEVTPESQVTELVYFKNEGDFDPYVNGIYTSLRTLVNNQTYGTEPSEELIAAQTARFSLAWTHGMSPNAEPLDYGFWYQTIGHCNLLLAKIEDFAFTTPENKKRLQAEALSLRAFTYLHLIRLIGDAPIITEAIVNDNVPLVPRSPAADVMKQITADLKLAISLFPENNYSKNGKYRFSFLAAQALMAEAKLWSAKVLAGTSSDYADALTAITAIESAALNTLVPDFKDVTTVRSNSEIILAAFMNRSETGGNSYTRFALSNFISVASAVNISSLPYSNSVDYAQAAYQISPQSRALFSTYPQDKRINNTWIFQRDKVGADTINGTAWINKYPGTKYTEDRIPDNDLIVFRLADVYLMAAEAYAATNNLAKSLEYLNKVRQRAGIPNFAGADKAAIEKEIFNERGRELFFENKRWYDLVRFHKGGTINVYTYLPNLIGKTTPLYWPIAPSVIARNAKIVQTTGY